MKTVDLFAGCGGLSLGLQKAGLNIVAAYENWEPALQVYKRNFHHEAHQFDLSNETAAIQHISAHSPELIAGGPPCQDFSSAGQRNEDGGRGELTLSFARIVVGVSPTWFIMENVDRIHKTLIFKEAKRIFEAAGYGLTEIILDASYCGVPQKRKRMFLIGRKNVSDNFLKEQLQARLSDKPLSVKQYFGDKLNTEFYYRHARSYARRAIFRIDEPSPTIRGVNRPIPPDYKFHPADATRNLKQVRPLTFAERASIQTFPKSFKWMPFGKSILEQIIGNAVPVNLAKFVGTEIVKFEKWMSSIKQNAA
jgi:DNA (cytosine-5)-methyltransferase 1